MELNLIRKIVWSHVRRNPGLEFDDLFQEACIACLEAEESYDPKRAGRNTYTWHVVHNRLATLIHKETTRHLREYSVDRPEPQWSAPGPEQFLIAQESWQELLHGLSPEGQAICQLTIDIEEELPVEKPKRSRGVVARALRGQGWSWAPIWAGFREVKMAFAAATK